MHMQSGKAVSQLFQSMGDELMCMDIDNIQFRHVCFLVCACFGSAHLQVFVYYAYTFKICQFICMLLLFMHFCLKVTFCISCPCVYVHACTDMLVCLLFSVVKYVFSVSLLQWSYLLTNALLNRDLFPSTTSEYRWMFM